MYIHYALMKKFVKNILLFNAKVKKVFWTMNISW